MNQQASLSTGQRIATLRQFFRSRRGSELALNGHAQTGEGREATQWPQTEWSDTQLDLQVSEND